MKSYKTTPPSFKTVLEHPWLWISTFFGSGCITPAPGTWGSFAAWGAFWLLDMWLGRSFIWAAALVLFVVGCVSVGKSTVYLNKVDHGSIVVDEVVAVWVVLLLTPLGFWWQLSSVIAFRFFDIVKLPPASVLDRGRQNGFTVMLDDIFAAVSAILVINSMAWVAGFYGAASPIWILR